jgi:hypothetical protein
MRAGQALALAVICALFACAPALARTESSASTSGASAARCHDWTAFKLRTQGARDRVVVSAVCSIRAGERIELRRHEPQGINPADLLLDLVVQRVPVLHSPVAGQVRVVHIEPDAGYKSVTVLPDGPTLPLADLDQA